MFKVKQQISRRIFNQENQENFKHALQIYEWEELEHLPDVNSVYQRFTSIVQKLYDKSFPIVTKLVNDSEQHRPWVTSGIRKSITKKNYLYKNYLKHRTEQSYLIYKSYRNKLAAILRKSEKKLLTIYKNWTVLKIT